MARTVHHRLFDTRAELAIDVTVLGSKLIDIPPGASQHVVTDEYELPVEVELMSVYPHAPADQKSYLKIYDTYQPLLAKLTPEAKQKFLKGNYERLFDAARTKVRACVSAEAPGRG